MEAGVDRVGAAGRTKTGCCCCLLLLVVAADCFCWLLLLIAAVGRCCWLPDACWLRLEYCLEARKSLNICGILVICG